MVWDLGGVDLDWGFRDGFGSWDSVILVVSESGRARYETGIRGRGVRSAGLRVTAMGSTFSGFWAVDN